MTLPRTACGHCLKLSKPASNVHALACERAQSATNLPAVSTSRSTVLCGPGVAHPGEERRDEMSRKLTVPTTGMAKGLGSTGGATMQRSKLSLKQESKSFQAKTDDGSGGGIGGKGIFNGGGGDNDDGDGDDYFDEFGDGDEGAGDSSFFRTVVLAENYSRVAIEAVLSEWMRTVSSLPLILRQAVEMGLFSSAQLVRFCAMDNRPNVTRTVSRLLPAQISRGLVGRMMADPAFLQKLLMEQAITVASSVWWEAEQRGDAFGRELDLVAINTLSLCAANAALVWMVSADRSFGTPHRMPWQKALHSLPNNLFDRSGPQRVYTSGSRAAGFLAKAAELSAVGVISGGLMSIGQSAAAALRRRSDPDWQPAVRTPELRASALGLAASMGIFANARYQIISGVDRYLFDHSAYLMSYLVASGIVRVASNRLGEPTRLVLQGLPVDAPQRAPQQQQYRQPVVAAASRQPAAAAQPAKPRRAAGAKGPRTGKKKAARGFEMSAAVAGA